MPTITHEQAILFQLHIIRPARSSARWPRVDPDIRYVYMSHENNMTRSPRENYSLGKGTTVAASQLYATEPIVLGMENGVR